VADYGELAGSLHTERHPADSKLERRTDQQRELKREEDNLLSNTQGFGPYLNVSVDPDSFHNLSQFQSPDVTSLGSGNPS
jgi:hypothetical protein